jgi:branched-chain amino acid transport system permease protein
MRRLAGNPLGMGLLLILLLIVLFFPFLDEFTKWRQITTVIPILLYTLLALGLNVVVGYAGLLDLGYAAFFAIGAYVAALMTSPLSILNGGTQHWWSNFWVAIVAAFFVAIAAGMILGAPTLRLRGDYLAIVTLGFGEIVPVVFRNATDVTNGEKGLGDVARPIIALGPVHLDIGGGPVFGLPNWSSQIPWYYLMLVILGISIFGLRRLQDSRIGRAWMAMREDEIAASAMGINLVSTKLSAFGMGASLSGAAGAVYGAYVSFVHPSAFEFSTSVILLCAVILGGLGNIWGVILGSIIIQSFDRILAPELTGVLQGLGNNIHNDFLSSIELSNWRYFIFGAALVIMMLSRPEGLLPSARRRAELRPEQDTINLGVEPEGPGLSHEGLEPSDESRQERETLYDARELGESIQEDR